MALSFHAFKLLLSHWLGAENTVFDFNFLLIRPIMSEAVDLLL